MIKDRTEHLNLSSVELKEFISSFDATVDPIQAAFVPLRFLIFINKIKMLVATEEDDSIPVEILCRILHSCGFITLDKESDEYDIDYYDPGEEEEDVKIL